MRIVVESTMDGYVQVNASEPGHKPLVFTKSGDKHEFETHSHFLPYSVGVTAMQGEGKLKVTTSEEGVKPAAPAKTEAPKVAMKAEAHKPKMEEKKHAPVNKKDEE